MIDTDTEPSMLPPSRKSNWKIIYAAFAILGIVGVVLALKYRQVPKRTEIVKKRAMPAVRAVFTAVLSPMPPNEIDGIMADIAADVMIDSANTDMVVGSTSYGKKCSSLREYRELVVESMQSTSHLPVGKQSLLFSQVLGVLMDDHTPATLYVMGDLRDGDFNDIRKRTSQSAGALEIRQKSIAPVRVVFYLRPKDAPVHRDYISYFQNNGYQVDVR